MRYELFYLVGASKEADLTRIREEVKNIVTENGGKFEEKETQEKRKLSYQIKHEVQGIYIAQRFELEDKDKLTEINSKLNLHNDVLRFILSRADELPELKSKEERIKEATNASQAKPEERKEVVSPAKAVESQEISKNKVEKSKKETKKEEAVIDASDISEDKSKEDIDKKLEEILNI